VETADELRAEDFVGMQRVGVLAGASTREVDVKAVSERLCQMGVAESSSDVDPGLVLA
jgi:4-hydroxy-3-methylbut-2-enyl diphosphate reductase IspH